MDLSHPRGSAAACEPVARGRRVLRGEPGDDVLQQGPAGRARRRGSEGTASERRRPQPERELQAVARATGDAVDPHPRAALAGRGYHPAAPERPRARALPVSQGLCGQPRGGRSPTDHVRPPPVRAVRDRPGHPQPGHDGASPRRSRALDDVGAVLLPRQDR